MKIIAHRCGDELYPENTVAGARSSLEIGADMVEIDVRFTLDGQPVVIHDADLNRLFGQDRCVEELTLEQFRELRYSTDPRYAPNSLDDFVDEKISPLLIHVKEGGRINELMDHLIARNYRERVILGITNHNDLSTVSERNEVWHTLGFIPHPSNWRDFADAEIIRLWDLWLETAAVTEMQEAGKEVWVMTGALPGFLPVGVFDERRISFYRRLSLDGVVVNEVQRITALLAYRDYPRLVAHRGLSLAAPENTLSAFLAAYSVGAREFELDVRGTKDRKLVLCHDESINRVARVASEYKNETTQDEPERLIAEMTLAEIRMIELSGDMQGVSLCTLKELLRTFGQSVNYNIHVKDIGDGYWIVARVIDLIRTYNLMHQAYIAGDEEVLRVSRRLEPEVGRCCLAGQTDGTLLQQAKRFDCGRVQFLRSHTTDEEIARAISAGFIVNYCCTNSFAEAEQLFGIGVNAVLTDRVDLLRPIVHQ